MNLINRLYKNKYIHEFGLFNLSILCVVFPIFRFNWLSIHHLPCHCAPPDYYFKPIYQHNFENFILLMILLILLYGMDLNFKKRDSKRKKMRFLPGIIEDVIHPLPGIILFFSTISLFAYTGFFLIFGWILMIYLNKYRRILFVFCMFTTFIVDPLFFMSAFACSCNKESMVKVNMHNLQIMLETYALDQGKYPENLSVLEREAKNPTHNTPSYWMNASNPMQYEENKNNYHIHASEILIKQKKANLYESFNSLKPYVDFGFIRFHYSDVRTRQIADYKGMAIYDRISDNQYYIYGVFYDNELIQTKHKRKRENYYILTNG